MNPFNSCQSRLSPWMISLAFGFEKIYNWKTFDSDEFSAPQLHGTSRNIIIYTRSRRTFIWYNNCAFFFLKCRAVPWRSEQGDFGCSRIFTPIGIVSRAAWLIRHAQFESERQMQQESLSYCAAGCASKDIHTHILLLSRTGLSPWLFLFPPNLHLSDASRRFSCGSVGGVVFGVRIGANRPLPKSPLDLRRNHRQLHVLSRSRYLFMCIALSSNGLSPPENTVGVDSGRLRATIRCTFTSWAEKNSQL